MHLHNRFTFLIILMFLWDIIFDAMYKLANKHKMFSTHIVAIYIIINIYNIISNSLNHLLLVIRNKQILISA